ncbi:MAG TPA: transcription-repair coupling factor [Chromatiaceae bacterium]|nr:transcription-repair coupling factor [Chromatiaceae bacterium]
MNNLPIPRKPDERLQWGQLHGDSLALAVAEAARASERLLCVATPDVHQANILSAALRFFLGDRLPVLGFPDWETLPYDVFSPLPELVSERLSTLHRLPSLKRGVLVAPLATLAQRLCPCSFVEQHALLMERGDRLELDSMRRRLESAGYQCVSQVMSHGEFAVRGALLDLFPMGSETPFRIDLFDDEIDTIRLFDPETQRSLEKIERIELLPAREFPLDEEAIARFRSNYRQQFEGDPSRSLIYRDVSEGMTPGGLEYYLPLFHEETATLFDYLPEEHLTLFPDDAQSLAAAFIDEVDSRHEQRRHDIERPLLPPRQLYLNADELIGRLKQGQAIQFRRHEIAARDKGYADIANLGTRMPPALPFQARATRPAGALQDAIRDFSGRILFTAETAGRREHLLDALKGFDIHPRVYDDWQAFLDGDEALAITIAPLEEGIWFNDQHLAIITETQLLGQRVRQPNRRKRREADSDQVVRNLTELHIGAPVVHEDHGVGRYLGLQKLAVGGAETEFLTLEYARGDKLYVPVSSLHLISRYAGASPDSAPLHKLGGDQWEKIKRKATQKAHDVAAELLDIYARREANRGHAFRLNEQEYAAFAAAFEFEETPDQASAIQAVIDDMRAPRPMDRVVCGDVGFGKTEVAMRAAFVAANGGKQVAVLAPTTLLVEQHYQNFLDRFSDWPFKIESLSRFRSAKEVKTISAGLKSGDIDILVGTHKLLGKDIQYKDLGLVIIDEEHRFGVRHKERLKSLRSQVDILTLTATPIPRTLNMAMSGMRDLSVIATPPVARHPIKTFVSVWDDALIVEAVQRELKRGGQVYYLHNEVSTIENAADKLARLVPEARIEVAHGQMRERQLEQVMRDFYHQRFNILACTTIIESGIDVPSANTIIIDRADHLGLAQLHQLRGRVGRSHHRAYAYLITPPKRAMTGDARKRLEAIESLEELGAGFTLATHDLEIRGAGELLGDEQSGQIHEIGFSMYSDLLERAVKALKEGKELTLDEPPRHGTEIDLQLPAILPDDYLPDVHERLVLYKRIASARDNAELRELKVEMIDRFGLLPPQANHLFGITALKLRVQPLGINKLDAGASDGRILLDSHHKLDMGLIIQLIQNQPDRFRVESDKLRFHGDFADPDTRIDKINSVIDKLTGKARA